MSRPFEPMGERAAIERRRYRAPRWIGLAAVAFLTLWSLPGCAGGGDDPVGDGSSYQDAGDLTPTQRQALTSERNRLELQQQSLQSQQYQGLSEPVLPPDPTRQRINPAVVSQRLSTNQAQIDQLNRQLAPAAPGPSFTPAPLSGVGAGAPSGFTSFGAGAPPIFAK